ncbi:biotin carboxyl carrier protein [Mycoplana dimorpha]|uniref:Biotin carboxyl carrier protein of acetyl-CoA carboxylase n=2 Tax=Mycoplana dimorpha TaxID=28320 RepID=A0A2T5BF38_MYCDI|nr:biotin carboxyl carrier protein [Mycoplana dimorpha]
MDLDVIERLMRMLAESEVEELEVTEGNLRIRLAKGAAVRSKVAGAQVAAGTAAANDANSLRLPRGDDEPEPGPAANSDLHIIVSGLPGTFFRAPAPGAEPFVSEGAAVRDGQQLAIVEAMKMMNPVEADCDGTVLEVLVGDAAPVQAGTPLFRVRKTSA